LPISPPTDTAAACPPQQYVRARNSRCRSKRPPVASRGHRHTPPVQQKRRMALGQLWLGGVGARGTRGRTAARSPRRLHVEGLELCAVPASMYDVQWLGTLSPADNFSGAQGINDLGQVVGNSYVQDANGIPGPGTPFLWTSTGGMTSLGNAG